MIDLVPEERSEITPNLVYRRSDLSRFAYNGPTKKRNFSMRKKLLYISKKKKKKYLLYNKYCYLLSTRKGYKNLIGVMYIFKVKKQKLSHVIYKGYIYSLLF